MSEEAKDLADRALDLLMALGSPDLYMRLESADLRLRNMQVSPARGEAGTADGGAALKLVFAGESMLLVSHLTEAVRDGDGRVRLACADGSSALFGTRPW